MQYFDKLNEVCRIATTHSIATLSKFLQTPIGVNISLIESVSVDTDVFLSPTSESVVSLYLSIKGNIAGAAVVYFTEKNAMIVCDKLLSKPIGTTCELDTLSVSALSELANILVGNFLMSFAQCLQIDLLLHHVSIFEILSIPKLNQKIFANSKPWCGTGGVKFSFNLQTRNSTMHVNFLFEQAKLFSVIDQFVRNERDFDLAFGGY